MWKRGTGVCCPPAPLPQAGCWIKAREHTERRGTTAQQGAGLSFIWPGSFCSLPRDAVKAHESQHQPFGREWHCRKGLMRTTCHRNDPGDTIQTENKNNPYIIFSFSALTAREGAGRKELYRRFHKHKYMTKQEMFITVTFAADVTLV